MVPTANFVAVIVVLLVAIIAISLVRRHRATSLQEPPYGAQYDRAVRQSGGSRGDVERERADRQERDQRTHTEELPPGVRTRYAEEWRTLQSRFVDEPKAAVINADRLVTSMMRDRGSNVDPSDLQNYRVAHDITTRSETGEVTTEDLRQAMTRYRSVFDDLAK